MEEELFYTETQTNLMASDLEVYNLLVAEERRQNDGLELIASENYTAPEVLEAVGSVAMWKYAEGYPGRRYYGGCENIDKIESLAIERLKRLFGCEYVNVQPHSGTEANLAAYAAFLKPGDKVMAMKLNSGGHLSHLTKLSLSSQLYKSCFYGVEENGRMNMEKVRQIALEERPQMIVAGASAYPFVIDFKAFREIADEIGAYLMVDIAHIAGLVAAGVHPSPIPYADVVTTTTHKTLRGPRGALILSHEKYAKQIDKAVFPTLQGGPLENMVAGKAVMAKLCLEGSFKEYGEQIIKNTRTLGAALMDCGLKLVGNGTENHLLLVDLTDTGYTGKEVEELLGKAHITVNKNMIPFDTRKPTETSGIRIGTAALTTRGMREREMMEIGYVIGNIIKNGEVGKNDLKFVKKLCDDFPIFC